MKFGFSIIHRSCNSGKGYRVYCTSPDNLTWRVDVFGEILLKISWLKDHFTPVFFRPIWKLVEKFKVQWFCSLKWKSLVQYMSWMYQISAWFLTEKKCLGLSLYERSKMSMTLKMRVAAFPQAEMVCTRHIRAARRFRAERSSWFWIKGSLRRFSKFYSQLELE